jgi:cation transport ATPase
VDHAPGDAEIEPSKPELVVEITTAKSANNGNLVRDRLVQERARLIDPLIFDKTGTFPEGRCGVVRAAVARAGPKANRNTPSRAGSARRARNETCRGPR